MDYIQGFRNESPRHFKGILQFLTYKSLNELQISYECIEMQEPVKENDRPFIRQQLDAPLAKTLFLKSGVPEEYYLYLMDEGSFFDQKRFREALRIPEVSPASEEEARKFLDTGKDHATIFSILLDSASGVRVVLDGDLTEREDLVFGDGSDTGFIRIRTSDLLERLLPRTEHTVDVIRSRE